MQINRGPVVSRVCAVSVVKAPDSLMRSIPSHLNKLLPLHGTKLNIKDWARGGLSSRTYMSYYRK